MVLESPPALAGYGTGIGRHRLGRLGVRGPLSLLLFSIGEANTEKDDCYRQQQEPARTSHGDTTTIPRVARARSVPVWLQVCPWGAGLSPRGALAPPLFAHRL